MEKRTVVILGGGTAGWMSAGMMAKTWQRRAIASGLSQGFIEPLEATAQHIVYETECSFTHCYKEGGFSDTCRDKHNQSLDARYQGVRDYIVAHFRVSSRTDTQYWLDSSNDNQLSRSLHSALLAWASGKSISDELKKQNIDKYFSSMIWHCLLAGYGMYPDQSRLRPANEQANQYDVNKIRDYVARRASNFDDHRTVPSRLAGRLVH